MAPGNDLGEWFKSIPIVSRWWFALSILFPLAGRVGIFSPFAMFLSWDLVAYKFQVCGTHNEKIYEAQRACLFSFFIF